MRTTFTTMLGAARRSSVETIGPREVDASAQHPAPARTSLVQLGRLTRFRYSWATPAPWRDWSSAWTERLGKPGGCLRARLGANYPNLQPRRNASFLGPD